MEMATSNAGHESHVNPDIRQTVYDKTLRCAMSLIERAYRANKEFPYVNVHAAVNRTLETVGGINLGRYD